MKLLYLTSGLLMVSINDVKAEHSMLINLPDVTNLEAVVHQEIELIQMDLMRLQIL